MDDPPPKLLRVHFSTLLLLLYTHLCLAADRITPGEPLLSNQTIVSAGGVFELGFFSPGSSPSSYLGIWYNEISPPAVVWVLNRNTPIADSTSSQLSITNGTLILFASSGVPIWAADVSTASSSLEAVLQDDGNFVLIDSANFSNSSSSSSPPPMWQSFDYPTDTLLPGQKLGRNKVTDEFGRLVSWVSDSDPSQGAYSLQLDPKGSIQYVTLYNSNSTMYSIPGVELMNNDSYTDSDNEVYFALSNSSGGVARIVLNSKGLVQGLSLAEGSKKWSIMWQEPRDQCQVFGYCGPFGGCDIDSSPLCSCPSGFVPKSDKEWSLGDFSRGCRRRSWLGCKDSGGGNGKNGDMFVPGYGLPDKGGQLSVGGLSYSVGSAQQCESVCSYSCNCTAYTYQGNGCSIWSGELYNLRKLRKDRYNQSVYIQIAGSENPDHVRSSRKVVIAATVGSIGIGILAILLGLFLMLRRNSRRKVEVKMAEIEKNKYGIGGGDEQNNTQLSFFSLKDVSAATDNFCESNKLGEGGFGPVYKGKLNGDQEVAMKRLSKKSGQGLEEFMNELKLIAKLQHIYLVRLLGCCVERDEKILIYEYMPNRSLDKFLFAAQGDDTKLEWGQRVKIAEGVAQGLLYIHKYSRLKIIHRDMKASNVLLDAAMNPKISDFGMARIFGIDQDEANTNRIVGTYGYMSPEYAFYGQFSEKSDVFSFGVLLLEIVSGRRNKDFYNREIPFSLLCWVWEHWKEGKPEEVIDPAVKNNGSLSNPIEAVKLIHVGLLCVQEAPSDRPTMSSVTQMLSSNVSQSFSLPGEPAFIARRAASETSDQVQDVHCSNNQITMSLPTGR